MTAFLTKKKKQFFFACDHTLMPALPLDLALDVRLEAGCEGGEGGLVWSAGVPDEVESVGIGLGNHVVMNVHDGLVRSAAIVLQNVVIGHATGRHEGVADNVEGTADLCHDFGGQLVGPLSVVLGDYERVAFGERVDVEKSENVFVLVHLEARDASADNLAEDARAVRHDGLHCCAGKCENTAAMTEVLQTLLFTGNLQGCISKGEGLTVGEEAQRVERDVYVYRAFALQNRAQVVVDEIAADTPHTALQAVRLLARAALGEQVQDELKGMLATAAANNPVLLVVAALVYEAAGKTEEAMRAAHQGTKVR